jgi:hypothetical protein
MFSKSGQQCSGFNPTNRRKDIMTQLNSTALNTLKSLGFDTLIMSAELASALSAQTDAQNKFVNATSEALRLAVVEGVRPEH